MSLDFILDDNYFDSGGNVELWEGEATNAGLGRVVSMDVCEDITTKVSSITEEGDYNSTKSESEVLLSESEKYKCVESVNDIDAQNNCFEESKFMCSYCNATFCSNYNRKRHETKRHGKEEVSKDEYACDYCTNKFNHNSDKLMHMNEKHSEHKLFKCSKCSSDFFIKKA